jgi:TolB-like protein/DNA-binding winged helix-turn-helix (wHTH) protein
MNDLYRFGQFVLDPRRRMLSRADSPVVLTPKAFDVLLFLVQHPNRLVTKEELLQAVWGDTFVEEGNLAQHISHLRKALGDNSDDTRLIVTIARKGYQFTANVTVTDAADTARQAAAQAPTTEPLTPEVLASAHSHWWKTSLALISPVILVGAGLVSWMHFRAPGPLTSQQKVMLAVLPFQNLTGDPQKEYLADGLTEEMISQLGRLSPGQLGVIARTSVMGYKHSNERLDKIGRDLSVEYVLESSLRESGDRLRLTAQLIHVKDQTHIWSKDYDYPASDILSVEDDVADAVAKEIRVRLTSQQQPALGHSYPVNQEAFDAYLQGFYFFQRNTNADTEMSVKYYERATQLDPKFALAWAGLSRVRHWQANIGLLPVEEGRRLARQAVERALALNANLAAAHIEMGRIQQQDDFDWLASDASFQRAVVLEPGNPEAARMAAYSALNLGRFDQALELNRRAAALDPLSPNSWEATAEIEFVVGQLDQAEADAKKALELNPDVWPGHILMCKIYLMQGRPQDALRESALERYEPFRQNVYPLAYYALGRRKESDAALSDFISKYDRYSFEIAQIYAFRNQSDEAFQWLDRALTRRDSGLIAMKVDPFLKSLHRDPRFAALLKKLNFPN